MPVEEALFQDCFASALIFQNPLRVCRNWHHVRLTTGCRGFSGPVPPPLLMKNFSSAHIQLVKVRGEASMVHTIALARV